MPPYLVNAAGEEILVWHSGRRDFVRWRHKRQFNPAPNGWLSLWVEMQWGDRKWWRWRSRRAPIWYVHPKYCPAGQWR